MRSINIQEAVGGYILSVHSDSAGSRYNPEVIVGDSKLVKRLREILAEGAVEDTTAKDPVQLNG